MTSSDSVIDREVTLQISEPWELSTSPDGDNPTAVVKAVASGDPSGRLLLELRKPVVYAGVSYRELVAVPRRDRSLVETLVRNEPAEANLYGIPEGRIHKDPFNSRWRGGLGLIGTLAISPHRQ